MKLFLYLTLNPEITNLKKGIYSHAILITFRLCHQNYSFGFAATADAYSFRVLEQSCSLPLEINLVY